MKQKRRRAFCAEAPVECTSAWLEGRSEQVDMAEGGPVGIFPECIWKSLGVLTKRGWHDQIRVVRNLTTPSGCSVADGLWDTNGEAMVACRLRAGDLDKAGSSGD